MIRFIRFLFSYALFDTATTINIDTHNTYQVYSVGDKNLQFGYTVDFLNNDKLVVGAPPHNQSATGMVTGGVYTCDLGGTSCKKITRGENPLLPAPNSRCFIPPPSTSACAGSGTSWYYDALYAECKPLAGKCTTSDPKLNVFDDQESCAQFCRREIADRIATSRQRARATLCRAKFQNLHADWVQLLQKDHRGDTMALPNLMEKGKVRVFDGESAESEVCDLPFVAKVLKNFPLLTGIKNVLSF